MPSRLTTARSETLEDVTFQSGAALALLHLALSQSEVHKVLFRDRLVLRAA